MKQMNDCIGHMKIGNAASALPSPGKNGVRIVESF